MKERRNLSRRKFIGGAMAPFVGLSLPGASAAHRLVWTKSVPLPEAREGYAAGVLNGRLVIAGGTYWDGTKGHWTRKRFSSSTHAFDPVAQSWETLPEAPIEFAYAAYTSVGDRLFVLGGYTGSEINRRIYSLERKQGRYVWSVYGEMPANRLFARALTVGSRICLLGGSTQFEPLDALGSCCMTRSATKSFLTFDTANPKSGWRELPPYPGARRWLFSSVADGQSVWMFGGMFQENPRDPIMTFNNVARYNLDAARWETMPPMPPFSPGADPWDTLVSAVLVKDRILLITFSKRVWQLDLRTLQYSKTTSLPEEALVDKFVWLDDRIIGAGGENKLEGLRRRSEWTFIGQLAAE